MNHPKRISHFAIISIISCGFVSFSSLAKGDNEIQGIEIGGYLMLDHNRFDSSFLEDSDNSKNLTDIRRVGLSFKTQLQDDWKAKLQISFSDDNAEIKGAYLQYKGWQWADLTLGKQKEAFGLEKLMSSRNLMMTERSLATEAIAPGRALGASLSGDFSSINWQLGYYQLDETEDASAVTGRLTWLPWQQDNNLLHFGVAFSERDLNGSEFRINEQMEVYSSDSLIEGKKLLADKASLSGIELLWQQDGFTAMSEWQKSVVTNTSNDQFDYQGGYVQLSYQLSGKNQKYKKGVLGTMSKGWQLTSRYSQFELIEEAREAQIFSVGVNYTVNKHLKFMADYIKAKQFIDNSEFDSGDAISLRAQYSF